MRTLLIWDGVPDESVLYLIDDAPDWLEKVHGKRLLVAGGERPPNNEQNTLLMRVGDALCEHPDQCWNPDGKWACVWADKKVDFSEPLVLTPGRAVEVIRCGFVTYASR